MSHPPPGLVVVGASLAGLRAVEAARASGYGGPITLVGAERHLPYDRPPLSKEFFDSGRVPTLPAALTLADLDVEVRLGCPATALDTEHRIVTVAGEALPYDALVIATGAAPRRLPGTEHLTNVRTLRDLEDARAIRDALARAARVVVVGGGFIGSELASAAHKSGLEVTVVEAAATPLVRAVGEEMGTALASLHGRNGVRLRCGVAVAELPTGPDPAVVAKVVLTDGEVLPADVVLVGIGAAPATEWLNGSGLRLEDGIVCDEHLATSAAGVYAAGDVARWPNAATGRLERLEHWTSAAEQGRVAGRNAVRPGDLETCSTVPYVWSDWYGHRIQLVGSHHGEEVVAAEGVPGTEERWTALYRHGDRLVGALLLDMPGDTMKYRALLRERGSWAEALDLAAARRARREQTAGDLSKAGQSA